MSKLKFMDSMSRTLGRTGLKLKKYSPEILIVTGIIGTVTSTVLACKATTKASGVLEEMHEDLDKVTEAIDICENGEYTEEDRKKDTAIIYTQAAVKMIKLYAPAVLLGTASIGCMVTSNGILKKRNVAIAAAYAGIDKSFKEYRGRVVERFGKELDHELKYNIKAKEFEEVVVDEKGKEKVVKNNVEVCDPNTYSDYARFYDDGCEGWTKDPELNLFFLKQQMNFANEKLKSQGHLFLNDVYTMLGIPKTKQGQIVGWIYDEENPIGDNFVDFGIYDVNRPAVRDFVNGYERTILLDFNVDGNILDLM